MYFGTNDCDEDFLLLLSLKQIKFFLGKVLWFSLI
jgi:hypothetical protein